MDNKYPRFMLAAPKSGSGKTMITCGLLTALLRRGINCRSFKTGPDYIDPMFHKSVLGVESANLDTFFLEKQQVRDLFIQRAEQAELSVIEGVMGYYDGMGGDTIWASSYDTAQAVSAPVVLILDCKGASLSLAAVVKGFLEYKKDSGIKGVILNRTSKVMEERLRPAFEELGVKVYGYLPECEAARLDSRHLGLVLPGELKELKDKLELLADQMEETIDIDGLLHLAETAEPLIRQKPIDSYTNNISRNTLIKPEPVRIGIARDQAFCFYYQENLQLLEEMGAELIPFSPLKDQALPDNIHGLLLGGGYPELYAKELAKNTSLRRQIKASYDNSMPIIAECGGFLYLHKELETREKESCPMVGIIDAKAFPEERLLRFGYVELTCQEDTVYCKKGEIFKGHEFHYWNTTDHGSSFTARKPGKQRQWDTIHCQGVLMAGFPHLYYPSNPVIAERFADLCRNYKNKGAAT